MRAELQNFRTSELQICRPFVGLCIISSILLLGANCEKKPATLPGMWHTGPRSGNSTYVFAQDGSFAIAGKRNVAGGNLEGRYQATKAGYILMLGKDPDVPTKH